jgi:aminoglycoside phosphotransferase family enzyme
MGQRRHVSLDEKVAFLRDPSSYPHRAGKVSAIETHFAWVFLAGQYAYKLKKPVRHEVIDYRALEARERACRAELRLNRRLARHVYLSVVPLTSHDRALALGDHGQVEDWLVKMRRLPASRMLEYTLLRRTLRSNELDRLVATLVRFFAAAERAPLPGQLYLRQLRQQVDANWRALRAAGSGLDQQRADFVANAQRCILQRAKPPLRARGSRLVDGHGDLRLEHVHLGPPVCVIDCLEFSRELRRLDPFEEIAFLALEIERVGRPKVATELVRRFCAAGNERIAPAIMCFYMSHRAFTRAKLAAWHLGDPQYPDPQPWLARANSYLLDAERHARHALHLLSSGRSRLVRGRPALEQRRQRRSAQHPHECLPEKRTNGQHAYTAGA